MAAPAQNIHTYVLLYFPKISLGSPALRLVGPFKDLDDASDFGRAWQDSEGDNPCWQTIEFERDEIAQVLIRVEPAAAARAALGVGMKALNPAPQTDPAGLATDAARYRYLRERDLDTIDKGGVFAGMTPKNVVLNLEDLDRAVDAAMAQQFDPPGTVSA